MFNVGGGPFAVVIRTCFSVELFFYGSCLEKVNGLKKGGGGGRVDCVGGLI